MSLKNSILPGKIYSFDPVAEIYDSTRALPVGIQTHIQSSLKDLLGTHRRTLEVGAGTGRISALLSQADINLTCLDVSPKMLEKLTEKLSSPAICADAHHLPFLNQSFSSIVMADVLHLLSDPRQALRECVRVARDYLILINQYIEFRDLNSLTNRRIDYLHDYSTESLKYGYRCEQIAGLSTASLKLLAQPFKVISFPRLYDTVSWDEAVRAIETKTFTPQWQIPFETHQKIMFSLKQGTQKMRLERGWQCELSIWKICDLKSLIDIDAKIWIKS